MPSTEPPSWNVTVPAAAGDTVAVSATPCPWSIDVAAADSVVLVGAAGAVMVAVRVSGSSAVPAA